VRQSIRGYADAVIEQAPGAAELSRMASELAAVRDLIDGSQDLRRALGDPGVPDPARRGVVTDLLEARIGTDPLRLLLYAIEADRATEFRDDVAWLATRFEAAARDEVPIGDVVLGHTAAKERLDGYTSGLLERVEDKRTLGTIEDELFRFLRIIDGSPELQAALTNRDQAIAAEPRRRLVVDLLQSRTIPTTVSLAAYATQVGRPRDYEDLLAHLVDRVAAESNRRLAEVQAPVELDETQRRHLAEALGRIAGRAIEVRVTVDPQVLAGFVATIGDTVVDGSARHRLELLKERLATPEAAITTGETS
jgi:F-type H+-transporting ATPase subunit delta